MLVIPAERQTGDGVFFDDEARALLAGLILHVAASAPPEKRSLVYVRELLTLSPSKSAQLFEEMSESPAARGMVARAAARHLQKAAREASGVVSSAQRHTFFLDSPRMAGVLDHSTFDLTDLKRGRQSIYLVLPADRLSTYQRWLRLMIVSGLQAMSRTPGRPAQRVLFLLDEFPALGRMDPVLQAISLLGGYGAAFWLFVQDLSQLKGKYGDEWSTFLSNSDVLQAFGTSDHFTAKLLSEMTGDSTIYVEGQSTNTGRSQGDFNITGTGNRGIGHNISEKGRKLLLPDEVRRLDPSRQLLFIKGSDPLLTNRINYLQDREFRSLYQENPMYQLTT
jgi:type IV secretion system protein VirD4